MVFVRAITITTTIKKIGNLGGILKE